MRFCWALIAGAAAFGAAPAATASALSQAADGLAAGDWVEVNTGLTHEFLESPVGSGTTLITYSDSATWDPIAREVRFFGSPANPETPWKFIIYRESSNNWTSGPMISNLDFGHGYDHNTVDPATGDVYFRHFNSMRVSRYSRQSGSWSSLPEIASSGSKQVAGALEYFPEMGGAVFVDSAMGVRLYKKSANRWETLSGTLPMGNYHNFASYSPAHKLMIFGGGNGDPHMYKMDVSGNIVRQNSPPLDLGVTDAVFTPDPVGGNFIVLSKDNGKLYEYDPVGDNWSTLSGSVPLPSDFDTIAAPISTYGVIMYISYTPSQAKVYLYRPSAGGSGQPVDTTPPAAPENLDSD